MSNNPFDHARSHQDRRLTEWEGELNEKMERAQAAHAAQGAAATTGMPISDVVIQRGLRGRFGGANIAVVGSWLEIARFIAPEPEPVTIQSNVGKMLYIPTPGAAPVPLPANQGGLGTTSIYPRVCLRIRVGSGNKDGGGTAGTYFAVAGDQFQVTGTYITVDARIFNDETSGNLFLFYASDPSSILDPTLTCPISVSLALGSPASAEMPTKWVQPQYPLNGSSSGSLGEQVFIGPGRIKQAHGFNTNGTQTDILYLMFFDSVSPTSPPAIPNNARPLWTIPMEGGSAPFSWDCIKSSRFFQQGLVWSVSSTGDIYTAPVASLNGFVRVDVELFAGAMELAGQSNTG